MSTDGSLRVSTSHSSRKSSGRCNSVQKWLLLMVGAFLFFFLGGGGGGGGGIGNSLVVGGN